MTDGSALSSRAIGDGSRRALASEWGGPEPGARQVPLSTRQRPADRRMIVRKP